MVPLDKVRKITGLQARIRGLDGLDKTTWHMVAPSVFLRDDRLTSISLQLKVSLVPPPLVSGVQQLHMHQYLHLAQPSLLVDGSGELEKGFVLHTIHYNAWIGSSPHGSPRSGKQGKTATAASARRRHTQRTAAKPIHVCTLPRSKNNLKH